MKETNLNTIIKNSFLQSGYFAHKIADPMGGTGIKNPYDGYAVTETYRLDWEAKLIKNKIQAFNFNKIEYHQEYNLNLIKKLRPYTECIYIVGLYIPYKFFYLFILDIELITYLKKQNKKSILKKEFEFLIEQNKFIPVQKKLIDVSKILEKKITKNYWRNIYDQNQSQQKTENKI